MVPGADRFRKSTSLAGNITGHAHGGVLAGSGAKGRGEPSWTALSSGAGCQWDTLAVLTLFERVVCPAGMAKGSTAWVGMGQSSGPSNRCSARYEVHPHVLVGLVNPAIGRDEAGDNVQVFGLGEVLPGENQIVTGAQQALAPALP